MKIIVVDDDATTLRVVGAALQSRGHDVVERDKAIGTTLAILREKPDVVLLDVRMPGLGGERLAALIRSGNGPHPIVILHSSLPSDELDRLALSSGAAGAVRKCGDPAVFVQQFDQIVARARRGK